MHDRKAKAEIVLETYCGDAALSLSQTVCDMHEAIFSLPPFNGRAAELAHQRAYYPNLTARPGFRLTIARESDQYVGFGYGYMLPADTQWWQGSIDPVSSQPTSETGHHRFVILDLGVLPSRRALGIGRAIHDELLSRSGADYAGVALQLEAAEAQRIFRRWGWQMVSLIDVDPPDPTAAYEVLVLDALAVRSANYDR
jgi:ribosomal protein S18 acetylase RimI-like enzyme